VPGTTATPSAGSGNRDIAVNETDRPIASDKVEGTAVYHRQGNRLGSVYNVMIDKYSGQVAYAVMSFGGYVVDVTRERLESGPAHGRDETPWSSNPDYGSGGV
jgi:PRC-barrel domain